MFDFFISRYPTHYEVMPDGYVRFIYKEDRMKDWMQLGEGEYSYWEDRVTRRANRPFYIAHALSILNRFNGHSLEPYSVAQHSLYVADLLEKESKLHALYGLVHDAHEAIVGDVTRPMQNSLSRAAQIELDAITDMAEKAVFHILNVPYPMPHTIRQDVKVADWKALAAEKRDIMPQCEWGWELPYPAPDAIVRPSLNYKLDESEWLTRYKLLMLECGLKLPERM